MTTKSRRTLSGLMSGVLSMTAVSANAQEPDTKPAAPATPAEPAAPAVDPLKAPDNVSAAPADAEKTESGLASIVLQKGTGTEKPAAADTVKVHYSGWQSSDGNLFDSSLTRGEPAEFALNQVIKGWTEGLQLMVVGEKRRFWIPADLAYGDTPSRPGGPSGMLVFDVELLDVTKAPETPKDLTPPADAEKTESGLAFSVLEKGTGTENPGAADTVKVHLIGWQSSDGMLIDNTEQRGEPAEFQLNQVLKGWTEGIQLMVVGEKRRFWIPADLAYGDTPTRPGSPSGMVVFDFKLLEITKAPEAPKDLIAPADAVKTESGLASKILTEGTGEATPTTEDMVTFHFSGWKADGEFLASSVGQPQPPQDMLGNIQIKGWLEALQLMKKGEKRRVWVPEALAFGADAPEGAPKGDLVFDLELVDFNPMPKAPEPPKPPKDPNAPEDVAAAPADAQKTESGIAFKILKAGEGDASPKATDMAKVHFSGWDATGVSIGSSQGRPDPMSFPLEKTPIVGWSEILQSMKKGETRRVWIPEELCFEGGPQPGAPAGALTFDLELVDFSTPPPAPETPADVAAAPADALKTESGLAYKVLKKGTGEKLLTEEDTAKVHYTGWTTDGKMFDSSVTRDELFPVNLRGGVIDGWIEGLKLMVEGEKTRFWIPAELAYGETPQRPGAPSGMLVFDIEVVEVVTPEPTPKIEAVTPPIKVEPLPKEEE